MNEPVPTSLPAGDWLPAQQGHRIWWCQGGDPAGLPVLIVHGGPGGASRGEPLRWFDGLPVRWILCDQRGCGRSLPSGEVGHNDLPALLGDIERLRSRLGLARWALAGGSWGARVATAYAAAFPTRVGGLLLRSPFTGLPAETRRYIAAWPAWLAEAGRHWLGAVAAEAVFALYDAPARPPAGVALERLCDDPRVVQAWSAYDEAQSAPGGIAASGSRCEPARLPAPTAAQQASWRLHAHYAARRWDHVGNAALPAPPVGWAGPVHVVWGEHDATCDPAIAAALVSTWPGAQAWAVPLAGHRMSDSRLAPALRQAAQAWVAALGTAGAA